MNSIESYLSSETKDLLETKDLSNHEKLIIALYEIKKTHPNAKFRCQQVAAFLAMNTEAPRGIWPMAQSIHRKFPSFPIEMIETNSQKAKLDISKVSSLLQIKAE